MAKLIAPPPKQPYTQVDPLPSFFWGSPVLNDANGRQFCPGFIGETFSSNPWDTVQIYIPIPFLTGILAELNVNRFPGICDVQVKRGRDLDRKKSAGSDGQRLTFKGISNADVDISVTIWTPEQLEVMRQLWNVIQPPVGKGSPAAFDCEHPQLGFNQVKSLCFVDSVGLIDGSTPRTKVFNIKAVEYFPPGTNSTVKTIKKSYDRGSLLDEDQPKPGDNPENLGPK